MLLKDFENSEEINHFSQESKDLITEMGNNEIFEFYETSSKRQCPEYEELKEGVWLDPIQAMLRRKLMKSGQRSTVMWCESLLWKDVGHREDCTIPVGQTKRMSRML